MWTTGELGLATWAHQGGEWSFDARGGSSGIGCLIPKSDRRYLSLSPVDQAELPNAAEQFVRGDGWHVNYPQGDGRFAIRLVLQPIFSTPHQLVVEATVSIQTDLLDSHPKIDLDVDCQSIDSIVPSDPTGDDKGSGAGSAPISVAIADEYCCGVLLGPHDRPFTTNHSTDSLLRLRLFGEFLEKGVIRRGRPWLVIDRSGRVPSEDQFVQWLEQLRVSPVPLT